MAIKNRAQTKRLIANAVSFREACRLLLASDGVFLWPPFYVNLYYAIELSLKAYLSSRGCDRAELKRLNHSLGGLAKRAAALGFEIEDPRLRELVQQIDGRLFELRYLEGQGDIEVVPAQEAIELVNVHVNTVAIELPHTEL